MTRKKLKTKDITSFFDRRPHPATNEVDQPPRPSPCIPADAKEDHSRRQQQAALRWCDENCIPENPRDCSVHDFVRMDPADRPPNLYFIKQLVDDPNLRRSVILAYVRQGVYQPSLRDYTSRGFSGRMRSFQKVWFERFKWLEYSPKTDAAYCLHCYLSREVMIMETDTNVYMQPSRGYRNWKKAASRDGFLLHVGTGCSRHLNAEAAFAEMQLTRHDIQLALDRTAKIERVQNRRGIGLIFDVCLHLARQGIPFRGNNEKEDSSNKGNFLEMIAFMKERMPAFSQQMEFAGGNAQYTSPAVQRQLVQCAADLVREKIVHTEIAGGYFALLVDEASCEAKREHMAIVVRFMCAVTGNIKERFLGTVHVRDTTANSLFDRLTSQISMWNLSLEQCRGQGYDGASNMAGDYNGLQKRIRDSCPYAYYVHCYAHRLNLVVVGATKQNVSVVEYFDIVQLIHTTCSASCKRKDHLLDVALDEKEKMLRDGFLETGRGLNQPMSTECLSSTRWNCTIRAILRVRELWIPISKVLEFVSVDASSAQKQADASGILDKMWTFDFVFHTELLVVVLGKVNMLSQYLQKRDMDIATAGRLVKQIRKELGEMKDRERSTEDDFSLTWNKAVGFCRFLEDHGGVTVPLKIDSWSRRGIRSRGKGKPNVPGSDRPQIHTQETHYYEDVFLPILNVVVGELDRRFSLDVLSLMELCGGLNPKGNFKNWCPNLFARIASDYYPNDFGDGLHDARMESLRFGEMAKADSRFQDTTTLGQLSTRMHDYDMHTIFPALFRVVCLACVLPVSTASTERSFSAMERAKTRFRSHVGDEWLSDLMLLHLERDLSSDIDRDVALDRFCTLTDRRIAL